MNRLLLLPALITTIIFLSCSGSKRSARSGEKDLATLIKRLNKKGGDEKIIEDLRNVYNSSYESGMQRLANYENDAAPQKWDKVIGELEGLQRMYETINKNAYALRMVKPVNFYNRIRDTKDSAASDYYMYAEEYFIRDGRQNSKEAYYAYDKSNRYIPNYKDSKAKMKEAYDRSIVAVLVNRIQFEDYGAGSWGWNSYNNSNLVTNDQIVRDLGYQSANNIPAKFYSDWDLRRANIAPDLVVDMVWRNMRFDQPRDQTRQYNRSKQIETGRDTANRPIYQTVTATVFVTQRDLNADADLNLIITDAVSRREIKWDRIPANYRFTIEFAEYNGDRRALDNSDWTLINRSRNQPMPRREDVLNDMMQRVYNDMLNRIKNTVNW
jgi:hypothetical protein